MAFIQVRVDEELKQQVKSVLDKMGLDMSSAIKMYLTQIAMFEKIPFQIITENGFTLQQELEIRQASAEAAMGINVTEAMELEEALEYLRNLDEDQIS